MNKKLFFFGLILVLIGVFVPLLTVIHIIKANYIVLFLSYTASVSGLFMGTISIAQAALKRKHQAREY